MIEKGLILIGNDAELLSQVLEEVKARVYIKSEASLDDSRALDMLVSCFRGLAKVGKEKETLQMHISPSDKCLVLGTIMPCPRHDNR
jgi:hypothetical protein